MNRATFQNSAMILLIIAIFTVQSTAQITFDVPVVTPALVGYWEWFSCGRYGNDNNLGWISTTCAEGAECYEGNRGHVLMTRPNPDCASGTMHLQFYGDDGGVLDQNRALKINCCDHIWFAQYSCEPVDQVIVFDTAIHYKITPVPDTCEGAGEVIPGRSTTSTTTTTTTSTPSAMPTSSTPTNVPSFVPSATKPSLSPIAACMPHDLTVDGVDGSFESMHNAAARATQTRRFNSLVTGAGWANGIKTADTWLAPVPLFNEQYGREPQARVTAMADGMPESPDGGVFAASAGNDVGGTESFWATIRGLEVGATYTLSFYQSFAGFSDFENHIGDEGAWWITFGDETQISTSVPFEGSGSQIWVREELIFHPTHSEQRLELGARFISAEGRWVYMAIDGIQLTRSASDEACLQSMAPTMAPSVDDRICPEGFTPHGKNGELNLLNRKIGDWPYVDTIEQCAQECLRWDCKAYEYHAPTGYCQTHSIANPSTGENPRGWFACIRDVVTQEPTCTIYRNRNTSNLICVDSASVFDAETELPSITSGWGWLSNDRDVAYTRTGDSEVASCELLCDEVERCVTFAFDSTSTGCYLYSAPNCETEASRFSDTDYSLYDKIPCDGIPISETSSFPTASPTDQQIEGCEPVDVQVIDGTFESMRDAQFGAKSAVMATENRRYNSLVTGAGWHNGFGTADTWLAPVPIFSSQFGRDPVGFQGMADGMPESPQGGVFAGAYCSSTHAESFWANIPDLEVGTPYTISFWQTNAGNSGSGAYHVNEGDAGSWKFVFGEEEVLSTPMPHEGYGDQVWRKEQFVFTPTSQTQRLEIACQFVSGTGRWVYLALDGLEFIKASNGVPCVDTKAPTLEPTVATTAPICPVGFEPNGENGELDLESHPVGFWPTVDSLTHCSEECNRLNCLAFRYNSFSQRCATHSVAVRTNRPNDADWSSCVRESGNCVQWRQREDLNYVCGPESSDFNESELPVEKDWTFSNLYGWYTLTVNSQGPMEFVNCRALCEATSRCNAYAYQAVVEGGESGCFLYSEQDCPAIFSGGLYKIHDRTLDCFTAEPSSTAEPTEEPRTTTISEDNQIELACPNGNTLDYLGYGRCRMDGQVLDFPYSTYTTRTKSVDCLSECEENADCIGAMVAYDYYCTHFMKDFVEFIDSEVPAFQDWDCHAKCHHVKHMNKCNEFRVNHYVIGDVAFRSLTVEGNPVDGYYLPSICADHCEADVRCNAFQFDKVGNRCHLHTSHRVVPCTPTSCANVAGRLTSGACGSPEDDQSVCPRGFTPHGENGRKGLKDHPTGTWERLNSVEECGQFCGAVSCLGFEYNTDTGLCATHSLVELQDHNNGALWVSCVLNTDEPTPMPTQSSETHTCPDGMHQVGTMSTNNDIGGYGLRTQAEVEEFMSFDDCASGCEALPICVAFNWRECGTCVWYNSVTPNRDDGRGWLFCAQDDFPTVSPTEMPSNTPTHIPTTTTQMPTMRPTDSPTDVVTIPYNGPTHICFTYEDPHVLPWHLESARDLSLRIDVAGNDHRHAGDYLVFEYGAYQVIATHDRHDQWNTHIYIRKNGADIYTFNGMTAVRTSDVAEVEVVTNPLDSGITFPHYKMLSQNTATFETEIVTLRNIPLNLRWLQRKTERDPAQVIKTHGSILFIELQWTEDPLITSGLCGANNANYQQFKLGNNVAAGNGRRELVMENESAPTCSMLSKCCGRLAGQFHAFESCKQDNYAGCCESDGADATCCGPDVSDAPRCTSTSCGDGEACNLVDGYCYPQREVADITAFKGVCNDLVDINFDRNYCSMTNGDLTCLQIIPASECPNGIAYVSKTMSSNDSTFFYDSCQFEWYAEYSCQAPVQACPADYIQVGEFGSDIRGEGLGKRSDIHTISECKARCEANADCTAFTFARPMEEDERTFSCTLYDSVAPNAMDGSKIFCKSADAPILDTVTFQTQFDFVKTGCDGLLKPLRQVIARTARVELRHIRAEATDCKNGDFLVHIDVDSSSSLNRVQETVVNDVFLQRLNIELKRNVNMDSSTAPRIIEAAATNEDDGGVGVGTICLIAVACLIAGVTIGFFSNRCLSSKEEEFDPEMGSPKRLPEFRPEVSLKELQVNDQVPDVDSNNSVTFYTQGGNTLRDGASAMLDQTWTEEE